MQRGSARFYPRHPRGWRRESTQKQLRGIQVSIHATLAGGDETLQLVPDELWEFLSTPPSRVATQGVYVHLLTSAVSIHATLAGGDQLLIQHGSKEIVSIHATLAGGDAML